ncbi:MAG: undecaprenyl diphosphate synthase family protein, partial [Candidatus Ratteibacteria bacterium]|nr:undecaprenyl diphosphate synthase family protein [Candidatus Ratteibacteria bacterium]
MKKEIILDKNKLPQHIAFIVDGNRRWAKEHKLPSFEGHRRGAQVV